MLVSPSILSADFGRLNEEIKGIEDSCDYIHVDVMDGHFVPNITIGAPVVKCIKSKKPLDCHLMIENPEKYLDDFISAGAYSISTHIELGKDSVLNCAKICRSKGIKYGVAINPETSVTELGPVIEYVDFVLVMSVHPGFGGQSFIKEVLEKVRYIKGIYASLMVQIDGGIDEKTVIEARDAGVDNVVAGNYIFKAKDRIAAIQSLKI